MSRRTSIRRHRASSRVERYALARRALFARVAATTPVGYLRTLDLWPDLRETARPHRFDFRFDEQVDDRGGTGPEAAAGQADDVRETPALSPSNATRSTGAISHASGRPLHRSLASSATAAGRRPHGKFQPSEEHAPTSPRTAVDSSHPSVSQHHGTFALAAADPARAEVEGATLLESADQAEKRPADLANREAVQPGSGGSRERALPDAHLPALDDALERTVEWPEDGAPRASALAGPPSSVASAPREQQVPGRSSSGQADVAAPAGTVPFVAVDARPHEEMPAPDSTKVALSTSGAVEPVSRLRPVSDIVSSADAFLTTRDRADAVISADDLGQEAPPEPPVRRQDVPSQAASTGRLRARVEELGSGSNAAKALRETGSNAAKALRETGSNAAKALRETGSNAAKALRETGSCGTRAPLAAVRRAVASSEPARPRAADALFLPTDSVDVSPAAWAARLARSLRGAAAVPPPNVRPASGPQDIDHGRPGKAPAIPARRHDAGTASRPAATGRRDEPVRVSERTRRFLKPLIGVDPSSVAIWQGPRSAAVAAAYHADGMAVGGDAIIVREGVAEETPEGLGLLAHELTHVGLHRQPRFVPPVARRLTEAVPALQDEETMARRVEARVIAAARSADEPRGSHQRTGNAHASMPVDAPARLPHASVESTPGRVPFFDATAPDASRDLIPPSPPSLPPASDWGGLPAPWEALPEWLTSSPPPAPQPGPATPGSRPVSTPSIPALAAAPAAVSTPPAAADAPSPRLAEQARTIERPPATTGTAAERARTVAPDLDVLARRVYSVLKRRLECEMRREQMF